MSLSLLQDLPKTERSRLYGHSAYALAIIWLVLVLRTVDLQIVSVLIEPIRSEFHVSDSAIGLLSGTAFALLYGVLGVPVALLADRRNRRTIIAACLGLWSLMTAFCGLSTTFATLLLFRAGVGVGEAGGSAPAFSLMSDSFSRNLRTLIFAILNTAVPTGIFLGLMMGGYLASHVGWRSTLFAFGAVGLTLSLIVRLTIREPPRSNDSTRSGLMVPSLKDVYTYLWSKPAYRHLVAATSIATLGAFGSGIWIVSFFVRVHHLSLLSASTSIALIYGAGGILGSLLGGLVAHYVATKTQDPRWLGRVPALAALLILPSSLFVYLYPVSDIALLAQILPVFFMHAWMGPAYSTVQTIAGPLRRATAAAFNLLFVNLIAFGCGPLLVGVLSDRFGSTFGETSLRYSLIFLVTLTAPWSSLHFAIASRTISTDSAQ